MDNQPINNKFKKEEERIKEKINSVEKGINDDLSLIPEYQLLKVYQKISQILIKDEKKYSVLKKKFLFKDKTLTGYINLKNFHDILNNNLTLERDELKILLCDPVLRNKINPNLYQYKPFLDKISNFDENVITKMRQEYNLDQNRYIMELRNTLIVRKIDIKKVWEKLYKDDIKCNKNNFYLFFNEIKSKYSYHYLELEYIFDLICKKGEDNIDYDTFKKILNKRPDEDLRVLYFKKIKQEKEKEEKKEAEKILINYYPNLIDNNTNNNIENNDKTDKTNYITIKEEDNLTGESEKEKFILGSNIDTTNSNINNNIDDNNNNNVNDKQKQQQEKKAINSVEEKLEIPHSLIFNEQSQNDNNISKTQSLQPKGVKLKKYYKIIFDINNNNNNLGDNNNTMIIKDKSYFDENNTKNKYDSNINDINDIIKNRINNSNEKVNNILGQHEEYIILKLYSSLNSQINLIDVDILKAFKNKDSQNKKFLSFNDFITILQKDLKLKFSQTDLKILLNSLENVDATNNIYSYEEFVQNINKYKYTNDEKIKNIERLALINLIHT